LAAAKPEFGSRQIRALRLSNLSPATATPEFGSSQVAYEQIGKTNHKEHTLVLKEVRIGGI